MIVQPIDVFVFIWLGLALASALYVGIDQFRNNPEPAVMKWGFILVTLYMGPIGLLLYVMADKEPVPGSHEDFTRPLWKQGVGSTIHCVAGDATGIILAAVITALLGLPMWLDLIVEYLAGFAFGLFIFQALFMQRIMGGSYVQNVRKSFMPEFISMNAMMAGMAPTMTLLMMGRDMRAMQPTEPLFWMAMSIGVTVGYAFAYPVNVWLVSRSLKHGLMTERPQGSRFDLAIIQRLTPRGAADAHAGHGAMQALAARQPPDPMAGINHTAGIQGSDISASQQGTPTTVPTASMAGMDHASGMQPNVTVPQLWAVFMVTALMLIAGMTLPSTVVNMKLSARDVGASIMPPGMIMTRETPGEAMRDMAAIDPRTVSYTAPGTARGDQRLVPQLVDGVKVFQLDTSVIQWNILPDKQVAAYAINRQVPGPRLEINQGDQVQFIVKNNLPEATTLHWHGLILPNEMDGVPGLEQRPIPPGGTFTYAFTAVQVGTYFYHSHQDSDRQQGLGEYGALIIRPTTEPANLERIRTLTVPGDRATAAESVAQDRTSLEYTLQLQEWLNRDGLTYPAMIMEGGLPNYFTINGKAYPSTDTLQMRVGQTVKLRFIGSNNNFVHPMHVHGGPFEVVARDGETLPTSGRFLADTVNVGPGQRYDVVWTARQPGKWLIHCHIPHHTKNNNVEQEGGGGLMMVIDVRT
ncbi:DUF4396 domain-containing protein [Deinococcus aquatilis]|uniref:DUF4396 domain-containing protein n=1 Tax=Deinococcus aquatilis TaxID=519440 RepID=UPI0003820345|nr:DUF4396 domain-containing protein [Deinococcus aquatilis]